jgi:uncharacterized protein involved in high-affinity Fe2+ transport
MTTRRFLAAHVFLGLALSAAAALGKEIPIGEPRAVSEAGLEVAAVYLQPIEMEPAAHDGRPLYLRRDRSDIHLEADIRALRGNPHGFREGEWVPGLLIRYRLRNADTGQEQSGILHPMVANDGPHYGANLKMMGLGTYRLTYVVGPPGRAAAEAPVRQAFGRATGTARWWKPFSIEWTFRYLGPGKKGGY